ncbi:hypothetical protein Nepgr_010600 [Nepenthes gracilis]|uniref:Pentatricopeptide repeat-containing protein n=1 Tax=Nepenthes gracilis TaxID=150966 RepID=A0AAD3XLH3_NEPGR|nr:hypothetical protein Nepgr_010600 [Nepenthes gracilis]
MAAMMTNIAFFLNHGCNSSFKHEFLISQKPALIGKKKEKGLVFGLREHDCRRNDSASNARIRDSSVILERDGGFKASFEEYLKAMECIKADREKKAPKRNNNKLSNKNSEECALREKDGPQNQENDGTLRLEKFRGSEIRRKAEDVEMDARNFQGVPMEKMGRKYAGDMVNGELNTDFTKKVTWYNNVTRKDAKIITHNREVVNEMIDGDGLEKTTRFKSSEFMSDVQDSPRVSRMEMEERIQKLARCLNGADIEMPEWMFSNMMRSAKIRFSDHSILRVIQILGKLGNWRRVLQVIEWLQMRERFKSHKLRYVYTAALDVLGKAKRPVEALNLFHAMQHQKCSYPDLVAYHSIAVTLGQAGYLKELFDVIDSMRSTPKNFKSGVLEKWNPQLEPDLVVYNAVLNACVRRKQWQGAFWVLQQLKKVDQRPSSTTYGLVMEVMLACDKYNLVYDFFKKVQRSFLPNALTYRVLVNAFWREGKTDEAVEAVKEMEQRGIVGSASLYYDLACCLCSAGRLQEALMQVDKICEVATKPLVVTYTGLIQACLGSGRIQDGAYIFNHMCKHCSPNSVTCNIMLKAYLDHGMFDEANELFQKVLQSYQHSHSADYKGAVPDVYTFNTMLGACVLHKKWDDFEYAYEQMLYHGYHFNTKRHLRMLLQVSRAGKIELVEKTWKHLARAECNPPAALVKERFRLKLENTDIVAAISSIASHPPSSLQQPFSKEAWLKLLEDDARCLKKEAVEQLMHEIEHFLSRTKSPNLKLQNLLESCKEFVGINGAVARKDLFVTPRALQLVTT